MIVITSGNTTEYQVHKFCADASDFGLPPGNFPSMFYTHLGNKQPFVLIDYNAERAKYQQDKGCLLLTVFND